MLYVLELLGVAAFAASGVVASRAKRPDILGALILAFATALGGGIIRDAILGVPAQSFREHGYLAAILVGATAAFVLAHRAERLGPALRVADALGLGLFNATGMIKAVASDEVGYAFAVLLGAITGSGGGIIRDVLCGEMPALLRSGELYVTACLAGGAAGLAAIALGASLDVAGAVIALVTVALRLAAIRFGWKLPVAPG